MVLNKFKLIQIRRFFVLGCLILITACSTEEPDSHVPNWQPVDFSYDHYERPYSFSVLSDQLSDVEKAGVENSFIGNYAKALQWFDRKNEQFNYNPQEVDAILTQHTFVPAIPLILDSAEHHRIVIVNEAHHVALHRVFTSQLLRGLYERGFRHFGLETLSTQEGYVEALNETGEVRFRTGYYTREPQFARLLREARQIGFQLFAYESVDEDMDGREAGQAHKIAEYIRGHPDGKVLIHCGYGHSAEALPDGTRIPMMAGRLSDTLNTDLLTINQTRYTERGSLAYDHPISRHVKLTEPSTLIDDQGQQYLSASGVQAQDIFVFHPNVKLIHGRPDYLFDDQRQARRIDLQNSETTFPALLQVYPATATNLNSLVPLDVQEVFKPEAMVGLPAGKYQLILLDGSGKAVAGWIDLE